MPPRHILFVNARNVTQPVFVIGAPHSGAESVGRALKISPGFHVTIGQQVVLQAVYGFARLPSLHSGRGEAAAAVMRDAFAQGWQIGSTSCIECTPQCRSAAGLRQEEVGPCAEERGLSRFGDASPDLTYCAEALVAAFPDAQIVQVVRDGRDSVAAMLTDQVAMSWFRPSVVNIETEFPNPFYGVEDESDRLLWPSLSDAAKCAMRWRGAVRIAARLRRALPADQLKTLRYEDMARSPGTAADMLSQFTGSKIAAPVTPLTRRTKLEQNEWRRSLSYGQLADIEKVAGEELRRLGYRLVRGGTPPCIPRSWEGFAPPCPPAGGLAKTARPPALWLRFKARHRWLLRKTGVAQPATPSAAAEVKPRWLLSSGAAQTAAPAAQPRCG